VRIGILGSADVAQALGGGFVERGDQVMLSSREPSRPQLQAWAARHGDGARIGTFTEAAEFAELVVLASAWSGTRNALQLAGPGRLGGKVVLDVTNPIEDYDTTPPRVLLGHTTSGGEQVQHWIPEARVVKVFNTVNAADMVRPAFAGGPVEMFLCGGDGSAKATAGQVCRDFGWRPVDMGGLEVARLLEPLAALWLTYGFRTGEWHHAFTLARR